MAKSPFGPFKSQPPRPPSIVIDRLGRAIEAGHLVLFHSDVDLVFEVTAVRPILNPGMPDGVMQVTLTAEFNVSSPSAQSNRALVIVGESQARLQAKAANNGKADPAYAELEKAYMEATEGNPPPPENIVTPERAAEYLADHEHAQCGACGDTAGMLALGQVCAACGDGTYQRVQD